MGTAIAFLMTKGVSENAARVILYAGGLLLLLGTFTGLVAAYNHHIIGQHEAKRVAATAKADLKANDHASEQRRIDDSRLAQEADQLKKVQANAKTDHDRSAARFHCIRLQQAARAAKRQPPACIGPGVSGGAAVAH